MAKAARQTDFALHDMPHCHAPIHPTVPFAHPPVPMTITLNCSPNVMFNNLPAAVQASQTLPCMLPGCSPGAPGMIANGSSSVLINGKPAARMGDLVTFPSCVGPIPSPTGHVLPPCSPTVDIGG